VDQAEQHTLIQETLVDLEEELTEWQVVKDLVMYHQYHHHKETLEGLDLQILILHYTDQLVAELLEVVVTQVVQEELVQQHQHQDHLLLFQ